MVPHRKSATGDARTRKMRGVLAACRRLGIDEEGRKELQLQVTGLASMARMDEDKLGRLLDHLNRDWKGSNPQRQHLSKVKALWWSLYWLGAIDEPSDRALSAFVKRQTGITALRFLDHRNAPTVIEALKSWLEREGVSWPEAGHPDRQRAERLAVLDAVNARLGSDPAAVDAAAFAVGVQGARTTWTARAIDDLIRALGKRLRGERR